MKSILSHALSFLLGLLAACFYYWAFVNPSLSERLRTICDEAQIGYVGDWVLDIFFPVIPLIVIISLVLMIRFITNKKRTNKAKTT